MHTSQERMLLCFAIAIALAGIIANAAAIQHVARFTTLGRSDPFHRSMKRLGIEVLTPIGQITQNDFDQREPVHQPMVPVRWMSKSCEWIVLISALICVARIAADPAWRDLLVKSPLAALCNLV
jgi:hypothetical protein